MTGRYTIRLNTKRVHYDLKVERKITIVSGDSGTGKTTFYRLVRDFNENGKATGISLSCDVEVKALTSTNWDKEEKVTGTYEAEKDGIYVVDEYCKFMFSRVFKSIVKKSSGYFILITRNSIKSLGYSLSSIYGLTAKKSQVGVYTENTFYSLYSDVREIVKPSIVQIGTIVAH